MINYLEQSTLGETSKGNEILQLDGRDLASSGLRLIFFAAFLRHPQAVCLSAVVVADEARLDAPSQQGLGGAPLPLFR